MINNNIKFEIKRKFKFSSIPLYLRWGYWVVHFLFNSKLFDKKY